MTFGGSKNQYFWNNSGKPQLIRTKFGRPIHAQVRGRQCIGNFGRDRTSRAKWGIRTTPASPVFFCPEDEMTVCQLSNCRFSPNWPRHVPSKTFGSDFRNFFSFMGHLPPKILDGQIGALQPSPWVTLQNASGYPTL